MDNELLKIDERVESPSVPTVDYSVFSGDKLPPKILHRQEQLEFLLYEALLLLKGNQDQSHINITGVTGTGKTVTVKKVLSDIDDALKVKPEWRKIKTFYHLSPTAMTMAKMLSRFLEEKFGIHKDVRVGAAELCGILERELLKLKEKEGWDGFIIVLDDMHRVKNINFNIFAGLLRNYKNLNVSLWLISNYSIKRFLPIELRSHIGQLIFPKYSIPELVDIFELHLREAHAMHMLPDKGMLYKIAQWVEDHGRSSVRAGLLLLKYSILNALKQKRNYVINEDIKNGERSVALDDLTNLLLSLKDVLIFIIALSLRRIILKRKNFVSIPELYTDFVNIVPHYLPLRKRTIQDFHYLIAELEENGLAIKQKKGRGRAQGVASYLIFSQPSLLLQALSDIFEGEEIPPEWSFENPKSIVSISPANTPLILYDYLQQKARTVKYFMPKDDEVMDVAYTPWVSLSSVEE